MYLFLVFLGWLFLEEKKYAFFVEHFIHRQSVWFYAISSILFTAVVYLSLSINPFLALSASIGSTVFFITDGFKKNAEEKEKELLNPHLSAWSKIFYLEALDASFSIDGVIGAFIIREFTIRGMWLVTKFAYLKNGTMYSIGVLGGLMILESFGKEFPFWLAPLNTVAVLALFFFLSYREIRAAEKLRRS